MIQRWKVPHILKGMLTCLPVLNAWRVRRASTGGSDSPRYCYAVWLRHLVTLDRYGFSIQGAHIGELGPGDSIGIGLAALLSGATHYVGLDIVPFSGKTDLEKIFNELLQMYTRSEPIPGHNEFPFVRPRLESYGFPHHLIDWTRLIGLAETIRHELRTGVNNGRCIQYQAPWISLDDIAVSSLDLIYSQSVLEHVDDLEKAYEGMFAWLKSGGYASHIIDFSAHNLSPFWNGHWAYSDLEWRLVRGRREFLLNRMPLSAHLKCARKIGFEVLLLQQNHGSGGLGIDALSQRFQTLGAEDVQARGAMLILRKQ